MIDQVERGEIYLADLNPVIGSEQGGIRPVLILQNDVGNFYSRTTIIASITSYIKCKHKLPTHLFIEARDGLYNNSVVLLEQIRTIDKNRLIKKMSMLNHREMINVDKCLIVSIGLSSWCL